MLGEGFALAALGTVLGALLGYGAGRAMESLLAGVRPADTATFLTAVGLVLSATAAGSLLPLRALRLDPTTSLRGE